MSLRSLINASTRFINPNISAIIKQNAGYSTDSNGKRTPLYCTGFPIQIQVQSLNQKEIEHINYLNLQGIIRGVYLDGNWKGIVRADKTGGDILIFSGYTWLVVEVLEAWAPWTKVAAWQQLT
jgi:hypothetical protein